MRHAPLPSVVLVALALAAAACSSQPTTERASLPDRPEVHRPEGVEPDGLAAIRSQLADQRGEARARENALIVNKTAMTQETTPWYETVWTTFDDLARFLGY